MTDHLVHVRDKSTGEEGYIGAAWLDRWPDDFEAIDPAQPAPVPAATPAPVAAPVDEARPAPTTTQF